MLECLLPSNSRHNNPSDKDLNIKHNKDLINNAYTERQPCSMTLDVDE